MGRQETGAAKRRAILDAALAEFSARGFAEARMEDIARAAGVAKGTIYLYFQDKKGLFDGLLRDVLGEVHAHTADIMADEGLSPHEKLFRVYAPLMDEDSRATAVIRLIYAEGLRSPDLVASYYQTLLAPLLAIKRERMQNAGCAPHPSLAAYPQLLVWPLIHGLLWNGLYAGAPHFDLPDLYRAYLDLILPEEPAPSPSSQTPTRSAKADP